MALGRTVIDPNVIQEMNVLIEQYRAEAQSREQAEIVAGKQLFDAPKPTIVRALTLKFDTFPPPAADEEQFLFWRQDGLKQRMLIKKSTTTYLTARRLWGAYVPVVNLLLGHGFSADHIKSLLLRFIPHLYGVLTVVRYWDDRKKFILLGVRSESAGSYSGFVSFPGGMTDCGESLDQTARREFQEEIGHKDIRFEDEYTMFQETERPNFTFARFAETKTQHIQKCNEWKGKVPVWAPQEIVMQALDGNNANLVQFLRDSGLAVQDNIAFAPDVITPAKLLLQIFKNII